MRLPGVLPKFIPPSLSKQIPNRRWERKAHNLEVRLFHGLYPASHRPPFSPLFIPLLSEKEQGKSGGGLGARSAVNAPREAAGSCGRCCSRCPAWNVCSIFQRPEIEGNSAPLSLGTVCSEPLARHHKGEDTGLAVLVECLPRLVQEVGLQWPLFLAQLQGSFVESDEGVFSLVLLRECHHGLGGS